MRPRQAVRPRQALLLVVATLALWTVGHFASNAAGVALAPGVSAAWARAVDLALLPLAALVAWLLLRRLPAGG